MSTQLSAAYAICARIARREAKNFYYGFLALPAAKRNAFYAVYAFMRRADDISDDESVAPEKRRVSIQEFVSEWRRVLGGAPTDDPVFMALRDAVQRFDIPRNRLDELIDGVTMDLNGAARHIETFDDLYRYCYYVASVVGLVCIRIFGYSDARAEKLAERTGVAFQLTNIIRDVKEDAAMGRCYLPAEDLRAFGFDERGFSITPVGELVQRNGDAVEASQFRKLMQFEAQRAQDFYASARELMPLISADSRSSLRVLVGIYSRLLQRIADRNYDVLSARVSLSGWEKTSILAKNLIRFART